MKRAFASPRFTRQVLRCLFALFLVCLPAGAAPAHAGLQTSIEKLLGHQAAAALLDQYGAETDPTLADWVSRVGNRVTAVSPRQDVRYRIRIIDIDEPNAISLPGGYIFVTKGLLEFVQDDDELAAIIAHETGHIAGRHGFNQLKGQILASLLLTAVRDHGGEWAGTAASLLDALLMLQRSRHDELAADRMGVEFTARAGYDPAGLISFFRKIEDPRKPSWLQGLFATHPPAQERIRQANMCPALKTPTPTALAAIGDRMVSECRYNRALQEYRLAFKLQPEDKALAAKIETTLAVQGKPVASPEAFSVAPEAERARQAMSAVLRDLTERQKQLNSRAQRNEKSLRDAWKRHAWTERMAAALLGAPQALDYRWIYLAMRAASLSAAVDQLIGSAARVMRTAPAALNQAVTVANTGIKQNVASAPRTLLSGIADDMDRAGRESLHSTEEAGKAFPELAEADRLIGAVLADLNTPYLIQWQGSLGHIGALEGFLQRAEYCLRKADAHLGGAQREAARARARAECASIDLTAAAADSASQAVFCGLTRKRLNVSEADLNELLAHGYPLGDAAVMLLFTRSTGQPLAKLTAVRGAHATWVETAEALGLRTDVQAINLRLLNNTIAEERIRD